MNDVILNELPRDKPNVQRPSGEYCAVADKQGEKLFEGSMDDLS